MQRSKKTELQELIPKYELSNRAERKSEKTISGYSEKIRPFCRYTKEKHGDTALSRFTKDNVRDYINYLQTRPKFLGHPFMPVSDEKLSAESVRDSVRALKAISTWIYEEGYTKDNRLEKLKLPKPEDILIEPLDENETMKVLNSIDQRTKIGRRNYAMTFLMLDTGIREGEVAGAELANFKPADGFLKVKGKGNKERIVPVGMEAQIIVSEYIRYVRSEMVKPGCTRIFVSDDGGPVTENSIKLFFSKLKKLSGIDRVHAHLCRHTFAINYLMNGGDIYSLKEILGHTTLEMVSRYLHFTKAQITARHREFSPMDRIVGNNKNKRKPK